MQRASFWSSGSSCLVKKAKNGSIPGAITAIITWAEGVTSLTGSSVVSGCSGAGDAYSFEGGGWHMALVSKELATDASLD